MPLFTLKPKKEEHDLLGAYIRVVDQFGFEVDGLVTHVEDKPYGYTVHVLSPADDE